MLDTKEYKPIALKMVGPTDNQVTVYAFTEVRINRPVDALSDPLLLPDLRQFRPNLHSPSD